MEEAMHIVYVKPDHRNCIVDIQSNAFLSDTEGWIEIDRGYGDRYHHAQGNYLDGPLYTSEGICRYCLKEGAVFLRAARELEEDARRLLQTNIPPRDVVIAWLMREIAAMKEGKSGV